MDLDVQYFYFMLLTVQFKEDHIRQQAGHFYYLNLGKKLAVTELINIFPLRVPDIHEAQNQSSFMFCLIFLSIHDVSKM